VYASGLFLTLTETNMNIRTNNKPRHLIYGYELTEQERKDFDYLESEELDTSTFFRYKGQIYSLGDFMRCESDELKNWHGYLSDSFFSGVLVRLSDCGESLVVATYYC
jgi:hypothetical protein